VKERSAAEAAVLYAPRLAKCQYVAARLSRRLASVYYEEERAGDAAIGRAALYRTPSRRLRVSRASNLCSSTSEAYPYASGDRRQTPRPQLR
jgi:hypothetical protein